MQMDTRFIRNKFSVVLERTVRELRGEQCLQIQNHRSLKNKLLLVEALENEVDLRSIKPLISNFAVRAGENSGMRDKNALKYQCLFPLVHLISKLNIEVFIAFSFLCPVDDTRSILSWSAIKLLNIV